ncbi:MAG: ABC transporter ATP-binding protein [Clostridia bacterium]|nr:ABC transporter ATP-binding protein [Clostridia bacterium]
MGSLVEIKNLCKSFEDKQVINQLNFDVREGEILTIFGPSGVGKSTLLRILAQLETYDYGEIHYDPIIFEKKVPLPVVFQETTQLLPWLTAMENMTLGNENLSLTEKLAEELEIKEVLKLYPHMLSGGMKQRVAIGRGVMCQSKIIFMDEPFSALDYQIRNKLQDLIIHLNQAYDLTIVFITHDISEAIKLGHRMLILGNNKNSCLENLKALNENMIKEIVASMN